jgi:hypothetical protein
VTVAFVDWAGEAGNSGGSEEGSWYKERNAIELDNWEETEWNCWSQGMYAKKLSVDWERKGKELNTLHDGKKETGSDLPPSIVFPLVLCTR